jgi:NADH-quinone oxidoreductase subunit E
VSVRRLHAIQPDSFAFTAENMAWAKRTIAKYPPGKQASAVIPVLWRAQEQNDNWVSKPVIEYVADMLDMSYIRVLEVATFYTMFQLQPVGKVAHIQVCGTTPCMLRGSDDVARACRDATGITGYGQTSADGAFTLSEVECLGACVNAPVLQVDDDYFEDLDYDRTRALIEALRRGERPQPGSTIGRINSAPDGGPLVLTGREGE